MSDDDDKTQDIPEGPKVGLKWGLKILFWIFAIGLLGLAGCFEWMVGFREFLEITDKPENGLHIVRHDNGHKLLEGNYENGQKIGKKSMPKRTSILARFLDRFLMDVGSQT